MPKEPKLEHPEPENARSPEKTWRILFVAGATHVEQLKASCLDVGYVVVGATTLDEAWAFLNGKDHVDVIVCTPHLEEESAFAFLRGVRDNPAHRHTVFLFLSLEPGVAGARLDRSAASAGMALGADAYVVMPAFHAAELIAQIRSLQPQVPVLQTVPDEEKRQAE